MSATSLSVFAVHFPNPEWSDVTEFTRLNTTHAFSYLTTFTLRTLAAAGAGAGSDITGLLYVPDLPKGDPCIDASSSYLPQNVTRQANLPNTDYDLIGMAPWVSPNCVLKYLDSASHDPIRAMMFYLPNNSTSQPPEADDSVWDVGDGDRWKQDTHFPIYAIPGATGSLLSRASAQYSGNVTDVPYSEYLVDKLDPRDYVRLFSDIDIGGSTSLPSLWVFLLVVLGILLAVIALTSFVMHMLQRRRREALRRRVANGEVDLEALGIKRLTVPQELLDKMPLYTYGAGTPVAPASVARERTEPSAASDKHTSSSSSRPSSPDPNAQPTPAFTRSSSYHPTPLEQPTCPICLDDFVPATAGGDRGTIVRELPCHHIFHPECVDTFLRDSSSLCPMCKKTALPKGYCPRVVTNAMVRRERMIRRIRPGSQQDPDVENENVSSPPAHSRSSQRVTTWSGFRHPRDRGGSRRVASAPPNDQSMTEMTQSPVNGLHSSAPTNPNSRREWARQRAVAMLGRRAPLDPDVEEAARTPRWRKALRTVFPGFRGGGGSRGARDAGG